MGVALGEVLLGWVRRGCQGRGRPRFGLRGEFGRDFLLGGAELTTDSVGGENGNRDYSKNGPVMPKSRIPRKKPSIKIYFSNLNFKTSVFRCPDPLYCVALNPLRQADLCDKVSKTMDKHESDAGYIFCHEA